MKSTMIETAKKERLENLFKVFVSEDGLKQFRIVTVKDAYVSKRVIRYKTPFGNSSAGDEVAYGTFNEAMEEEVRWLNG